MSPYYSFVLLSRRQGLVFYWILPNFHSLVPATSRKLKDLLCYTVNFSTNFTLLFLTSDCLTKKSVEMRCLDSVLHTGLISLVPSIHLKFVGVEVAFLRMRFLQVGKNLDVSSLPVPTALNLTFRVLLYLNYIYIYV